MVKVTKNKVKVVRLSFLPLSNRGRFGVFTVNQTTFSAFYREEDLPTKISHLIRGIKHDSMDVRYVTLSRLRALLHNNQVRNSS